MLPRFPKSESREIDAITQQIALVFANISRDNFKSVTVEGVTDGTANTSKKFRHGLGGQPSLVFILEGNAYVARNGVGSDEVDVRSAQASQPFLALVVR